MNLLLSVHVVHRVNLNVAVSNKFVKQIIEIILIRNIYNTVTFENKYDYMIARHLSYLNITTKPVQSELE